ncbi:MAG: 23S rRNA (guanosine(2251)-2'-O)-methyltransferase RlmB [Clostridia bacterium]|nr:23S rRNA (guanosine(2251)-2'-O)-methyltransferase RlmB [Clostridia bacterium]MBR6290153.1 23S rRNA (guanosine(2251)-2'-O)-methyltransferase RlmB [Clostridia bacterium]
MDHENKRPPEGVTAGRNAVRELLLSGRSVDKLFAARGDARVREIVDLAKSAGVPVADADWDRLDSLCPGVRHQGVVAFSAAKDFSTVEDILSLAKERGETPLIVICDGVEDPHNLGAVIRVAECAGAHGVIIPKRRSVGLTPTVAKASAGAVEYVPVARVANIPTLIERLKEEGIWTYAAEADGAPYYETDFDRPAAIVLGSEGRGVSDLVKRSCDYTVSIPMYGKVNSLNVSTAASVLVCHAARMQRTGGAGKE